MLSWEASLFHPLAALILVANYLAAPGLCSHDPGTIPCQNPRTTNNRFPIGDSFEIAWLSPSLGQQTFDLDLVLPNRTLNGWIPNGIRATATNTNAFNHTIPDQLHKRTILASNYQNNIHSSNVPGGSDLNPTRSPIISVDTNVPCHHQFRSTSENSRTGCTDDKPVPRPLLIGSSGRAPDGAVSFAALVVAVLSATVLLE